MHVRSLGAEVRVTSAFCPRSWCRRTKVRCRVSKSEGASLAEPADEADEAVGELLPSGLDGESPEAGMEEELPDAP